MSKKSLILGTSALICVVQSPSKVLPYSGKLTNSTTLPIETLQFPIMPFYISTQKAVAIDNDTAVAHRTVSETLLRNSATAPTCRSFSNVEFIVFTYLRRKGLSFGPRFLAWSQWLLLA